MRGKCPQESRNTQEWLCISSIGELTHTKLHTHTTSIRKAPHDKAKEDRVIVREYEIFHQTLRFFVSFDKLLTILDSIPISKGC